MNRIKRTIGVLALTSMLGMTVMATEPSPPSCSPTDGIMQTPPCATAQSVTDDSSAPSQPETSPTSSTLDVTSTVEEALVAFLLF